MSAVMALTGSLKRMRGPDHPLFVGALRHANDLELLRHFVGRTQIRYFPVADPDETRRDKIDRILDNCFEFNGETYRFPRLVPWLENPSRDIEWHILLHKFYYAVGLGMAFQESHEAAYLHAWISLTDSWISVTPPGFIAADVTGRRVQNWIYAYYYFVINNTWEPVSPGFHRRFLLSLHQQVEYLCANLHPARNHRTLELYAIFLASLVFPEFAAASRWREFAVTELVKNTLTDLLPDGVQCELSTDYHHLVLKNYLNVRRLAAINRIPIPAAMDKRLRLALDFCAHAHKPDGLVPSFSDGDVRSYLDLLLQGYELYGDETWLYVGTQGRHGKPPSTCNRGFDHGGYYFVRSGWGENEPYADERYLAFDCGPLGAGNHGHLDLLNVELAAYGRSLVVDPGRYTYDEGGPINWRVRFRGTAYHNTIQVDGLNQTEYRPRPGKRHKISGPSPDHCLHRRIDRQGFDYLYGSARSYCYEAVHHRHVLALHGDYWLIIDQMQARTPHRYDLRYHLSEIADNRLQVIRTRSQCLVDSPHLLVGHCPQAEDEFDVEPGYLSYRYGHKLSAPVLRYTRHAETTWFATLLYPWREHRPQAQIRVQPVSAFAPTDREAFGVRVETLVAGRTRIDECLVSAVGEVPGDWRFGSYRVRGDYFFASHDGCGHLHDLQLSDAGEAWENGALLEPPEPCAEMPA